MINLVTPLLLMSLASGISGVSTVDEIKPLDGSVVVSITRDAEPAILRISDDDCNCDDDCDGNCSKDIKVSLARLTKEIHSHHNDTFDNHDEKEQHTHNNGNKRGHRNDRNEQNSGRHEREYHDDERDTTESSTFSNESNINMTNEVDQNFNNITSLDADSLYNEQKLTLDTQYEHMFSLKEELNDAREANSKKHQEYHALKHSYNHQLKELIASWVMNLNT